MGLYTRSKRREAAISLDAFRDTRYDMRLDEGGDRVLYSRQGAWGRHARSGGLFPHAVWAAFAPVGQYRRYRAAVCRELKLIDFIDGIGR